MDVGLFVAPQQAGATYEEELAVARAAEAAGFASLVRSDHVMANPGFPPGAGPTDAWVTLGALARETTRIRLGTMVSPATFRLPGMLAIAVAQVDAMSGGRVILGIGAGWYEQEHRAYGIPFPAATERFEILEEQLTILRGMWTTPEGATFNFAGRHFTIEECPVLPRPVQTPHPPIVVGGSGMRRTPRVAAAFADELNASPPGRPENVAGFFVSGSDACERLGREPSSLRRSVTVTVVCGTNRGSVAARLERSGGYADVAGGPEQVVELLNAYRTVGATSAYLRLVDLRDLDQIRLIGDTVLPALSGGRE